MRYALTFAFVLLLIITLLFSPPDNLVAQIKYGIVTEGTNQSCVQNPTGQYSTWRDCQLALHPGKYSLVSTTYPVRGQTCTPDQNGPYDWISYQLALHPGKYKIVEAGNNVGPSSKTCTPDPSGPFTWEECQVELQHQLHPDKYKIVDVGTLGPDSKTCAPDPNGPFTWDECQVELQRQLHPGKYKIVSIQSTIGLPDTPACTQDPDGPFTWEECQAELARLRINPPSGPSGENPCPLTGYGRVCHTALGWIPVDITAFAGKFLSIAIGIAGGLALILLVYGSIRVLTSSGNQQSLATGRDIIIAAVSGLLFLIFSILILRALGIIVGVPFTI